MTYILHEKTRDKLCYFHVYVERRLRGRTSIAQKDDER